MKYVAEAISDSGSYVPVIGMTSWSVVRVHIRTYAMGSNTRIHFSFSSVFCLCICLYLVMFHERFVIV